MDVIDWSALRDNCAGDDALVEEIIQLFRQEGPALLEDVRSAVHSGEATAVKKAAHRLKGALVSLAAARASAAAKDLELQGHDNDLRRAATTLSDLEREVGLLLVAVVKRQGARPS